MVKIDLVTPPPEKIYIVPVSFKTGSEAITKVQPLFVRLIHQLITNPALQVSVLLGTLGITALVAKIKFDNKKNKLIQLTNGKINEMMENNKDALDKIKGAIDTAKTSIDDGRKDALSAIDNTVKDIGKFVTNSSNFIKSGASDFVDNAKDTIDDHRLRITQKPKALKGTGDETPHKRLGEYAKTVDDKPEPAKTSSSGNVQTSKRPKSLGEFAKKYNK